MSDALIADRRCIGNKDELSTVEQSAPGAILHLLRSLHPRKTHSLQLLSDVSCVVIRHATNKIDHSS